MNFTVPVDHRIKLKESEKKYKYFARELKKIIEYEGDNYTYRDWCFWYSHQRIIKGAEGLGDYPNYNISNYNIFENDQNTEKSPGDLRDSLSLKLQ